MDLMRNVPSPLSKVLQYTPSPENSSNPRKLKIILLAGVLISTFQDFLYPAKSSTLLKIYCSPIFRNIFLLK